MPTKPNTPFIYNSHANPILLPTINKNGQSFSEPMTQTPIINIALDTSLYTQDLKKNITKTKLLKSRRTFLMLPSGLTSPLLAMAALTIIVVFSLRPLSSLGSKFNYASSGTEQNEFVASVGNAVQGMVNYVESIFQGNKQDLMYIRPKDATDRDTMTQ